jgi:hypothetical protein
MKATFGNLRIDQNYTMSGQEYNGKCNNNDLYGEICENCGKYITNIAIVKGSDDNRTYRIGLDCASTLTGIEPDKIAQANKILKQKAKLYKELDTIIKTAIVSINYNTAWLYDYDLGKWSTGFRWRMNYEAFKDIINNGKINIIIEEKV